MRIRGPIRNLIPAVFRQRVLLQHLLAALLEAHPRALLEFQRERPQPVGEHPAPPAVSVPHRAHAESKPASKPLTGDFFVLDPRLSLRSPQTVESLAFRLSFTGSTATLRAFLNRLADFDLPILIRVIEVEPAKPGEGDPLSTLGRSHTSLIPGHRARGRCRQTSGTAGRPGALSIHGDRRVRRICRDRESPG